MQMSKERTIGTLMFITGTLIIVLQFYSSHLSTTAELINLLISNWWAVIVNIVGLYFVFHAINKQKPSK